jgi:hypothetical protein
MNEDTRVINCCYAGDVHYINLPAMLHHGCPVTIMSPADSKAIIEHPGVDCAFAGKRAYTGQDSLDRQHEHLKLMLTYPENYFLIHDSDSVMLTPRIPDYLYRDPDVVWSNQVDDGIPDHQAYFPSDWPHVAFQPPYFLSRKTIEAMVAARESGHPFTNASPMMPFIDFYMVQLTMVAGLRWSRFRDCISCPITLNPISHPVERRRADTQALYLRHIAMVYEGVSKRGVSILHSVKDPEAVDYFMQGYREYLENNPGAIGGGRQLPPPRVGPVKHYTHGGNPNGGVKA